MSEDWELHKLEDVLVKSEMTDPTKNPNKEFVYIDVSSVNKETKEIENPSKILGKNAPSRARKLIKVNDVIFATVRPTHNRVALITEEYDRQVCSTGYFVLRGKEKIDNKYLFYFLQTEEFNKQMEVLQKGASYPAVTDSEVKGIFIRYPKSIQEQQHIVAILDKTFVAIDQAKANIEKNIQNAKELFQSKLNEIFSQKSEGWEHDTLINLTTKIGSGSTPRGGQASYKKEGISLIRSMNVHDNGFKHRNLAFIDEAQAKKLDNVTIEEGDVLLNITGASVARCCKVPKDYLPARVNQHVSIIRPIKEKLDSDFLHYILTSKTTKDKLLGIGEQGATRQAITKAQIETFEISYPISIDAQRKTMHELNEVREKTERLAFSYQEKNNRLDELKKSILQKAFSGELINLKSVCYGI